MSELNCTKNLQYLSDTAHETEICCVEIANNADLAYVNEIRTNIIISLAKLMVSHDLQHSMLTNQIAFDQRHLHLTPEFECLMDRRCQVLVSKLETFDSITLPNCYDHYRWSHSFLAMKT